MTSPYYGKSDVHNPNKPSKRHKKLLYSTEPTSVTLNQQVKEFLNEPFVVSASKLFYSACREEVSLKLSIIHNHLKANKHAHGKEALSSKRDIAEALQQFTDKNHPSGETLPEAQRVFRVQVVVLFLKKGVPLNKLEEFREVMEQNAYRRLADRHGTCDLISIVFKKEQNTIKAEILGENVSAVFYGTSRIGEALLIVAIIQFVDNWKLEQCLIRVQMLTKNKTHMNSLIFSVEYSISTERLLACMHNRASANGVAMQPQGAVPKPCEYWVLFSHN